MAEQTLPSEHVQNVLKMSPQEMSSETLCWLSGRGGYVIKDNNRVYWRERNNCNDIQWVRKHHPDLIQAARLHIEQVKLCWHCGKKLVPVGHARRNGAAHVDWSTRKVHKQCWRELVYDSEKA